MALIHFLTLSPIEVPLSAVIAAAKKKELLQVIKLKRLPAVSMTHDEIIASTITQDKVTANEANRVLNIGQSRPALMKFNDVSFTEGECDYLNAFKMLRCARISDYRLSVSLSVGQVILDAVDKNPALADTTVTMELIIAGGTKTHNRRLNGVILTFDADASDFGLVKPDFTGFRRNAAGHTSLRMPVAV